VAPQLSSSLRTDLQIDYRCRSIVGDFELECPLGLLLHDDSASGHAVAMSHIPNPQPDEIARFELAVDSQAERREIASAARDLKPDADAIERDVEEELQASQGRIQCDRYGPLIDQVQLEVPQIFDCRGVGRANQEGSQLVNGECRVPESCARACACACRRSCAGAGRSRVPVRIDESMVLLLLVNEADCLAYQHRRISRATNCRRRSQMASASGLVQRS